MYKHLFKEFDMKMYLSLLVMGIIPIIYTTIRINFLGNIPDTWGFNIASQLAWINIMYEVIQEGLLFPLYFIIGKDFKNSIANNKEILENKLNIGLIITISVFAITSLIIFIFTKTLVVRMLQETTTIDATVSYIHLELIAKVIFSAVQFYNVILILLGKEKLVYFYLLVQMLSSILFDTLFVSSFNFSLDLGVNGVAYSNILTNIILVIFMNKVLIKEGIKPFKIHKKVKNSWIFEWIKVGSYSGLESFVRNTAYVLMVLKMVNMVGKSGTFWVANNFIWGWLLLPIIQLGLLIKKDTSQNKDSILTNFQGYFSVTTIIVILWILLLPFFPYFIKNVMNVSNYKEVYHLVIISLAFYILFAYNNIADNYFYGIGRTDYLLMQSVIVNVLEYGTLYVLFLFHIYNPTLNRITIMFAFGIGLDSFITFIIFYKHLKKEYGKKLNIKKLLNFSFCL